MAIVTSVKLPTTATGASPWATTSDALIEDAVYASCLVSTFTGPPLSLSGFGFALPASGATITGITVRVKGKYLSRWISVAAGIAQTGRTTVSKPKQALPVANGNLTFGSSTDLWGRSWLTSDLNDPSFTILLTPSQAAGAAGTAQIDVVEVTVSYDSFLAISYEFGITPGNVSDTLPIQPISLDFSTDPFNLSDSRGFTRSASNGGVMPAITNGQLDCAIGTMAGGLIPLSIVSSQMIDLDPSGGEVRCRVTLPAGTAGNGLLAAFVYTMQRAAGPNEGGARSFAITFRKNTNGPRLIYVTENMDGGAAFNSIVLTDPPGLGDTIVMRMRIQNERWTFDYSVDGTQWNLLTYSVTPWPIPKVKLGGTIQMYAAAMANGFPTSVQSALFDDYYWSGTGRQMFPVYLGRVTGQAVVSSTQYITPQAIDPTSTVGSPNVSLGLKIYPPSIGPGTGIGTPTLVQAGRIKPFGIGPGPTYSDAIRKDHPVAYWRLEEPSGVFVDDVGSNNASATHPLNLSRASGGLAPSDRDGKAPVWNDICGLNFPTNRYSGMPFTIEALVLPLDLPDGVTGAMQRVIYTSQTHIIRIDWVVGGATYGNAPRFIVWWRKADGSFLNAWSAVNIQLGRTYHLAGVIEPGSSKIYVDGALIGGFSSVTNDGTSYTDTTAGGISVGGAASWKGVIDEVAVYNVPLTPAQIAAHRAALTAPAQVGVPMVPRFIVPTGIGPGSKLGGPTLLRVPAVLPPAPRAEIAWRLILCDANGTPIEDLSPFAFDRKLSYRLNRPESLTFRVPADARLVNEIAPDGRPNLATIRRTVKAYRAERQPDGTERYTLRFVGIVWQIQDVGDYDSAWTTVTCFGPMQRLARRLSVSSAGAETGVVYTNVDGGLIVHTILGKLNTSSYTGIDQGTREATTARTVDFTFLPVADAISQLANTYQGFDVNFVPLDRRDGHLARLDILARRGIYRPNAIFAWGLPPHNVSGADRLMDAEVFANSVALLGATPETDGALPIVANAVDNASIADVKQYRVIDSYPDVASSTYLTALANEELTYRKQTREIVTFTPQPGRAPEPFTDYDLGDTIPIYVGSRLRGGFQGAVRVYGFDIDVTNEGAERVSSLTLSPEGA